MGRLLYKGQMSGLCLIGLLCFRRLKGDDHRIGKGVVHHLPDRFWRGSQIIGPGVFRIFKNGSEPGFEILAIPGIVRVVQPKV